MVQQNIVCIELYLLSVKVTDGSLRSHKMSVLTLQLRFVARTSVPVKLNRNSLKKRESTTSRSKINTCEFSHWIFSTACRVPRIIYKWQNGV